MLARLTPIAASFRVLCLRNLIERWKDVVKWLAFLLMVARSASNTDEILNVCVTAVMPIIITPDSGVVYDEGQSLVEELVYLPYTIDFVLLFLAQRDARTGRYLHIGDTHGCCKITSVFCQFLKSSETFRPVMERLSNAGRGTQRGIIRCIVERSRRIALGAVFIPIEDKMCKHAIITGLKSISTLIFSTSELLSVRSLYACFARCDFVCQYFTALAVLSKAVHERYSELDKRGELKGFWESISAATVFLAKRVVMEKTPNPIVSFASAMHGGVVDTALRGVCHLPPESDEVRALIEVVGVCVSYFTVGRVWTMAIVRRGQAIAELLHEAGATSPAAKVICKVVWEELKRGEKTYGETGGEERIKGVSLCANRKVCCSHCVCRERPFSFDTAVPVR